MRRLVLLALSALVVLAAPAAAHDKHGGGLKKIDHFVVIYQENHSFDNLYGKWEKVDGLRDADVAHTQQVDQAGAPYQCLMQNDVNLTSPPLSPVCTGTDANGNAFTSHFLNAPFQIDDYIAPSDTTCPAPGASGNVPKGSGLPGGCTRDLVHRFYQEQYQLNGGQQNRYTTGSDAVGLTQGTYDTRALPVYKYLHEKHAPNYVISDRFFQAAFGGSFLNHQWLVAAATPTYPGAPTTLHPLVDDNGMPNTYPLYTPLSPVVDGALTASCTPGPGRGPTPAGVTCGDYAVNTIQPFYQPYQPNTPDASRLPPQDGPTIGSRLSDKGIDWAWYSGGWSNADGDIGAPGWTNGTGPSCSDPNARTDATFPNCPDKLFQFHHQPLNYFRAYAPKTAARTQHLRDEVEFEDLAADSGRRCHLKPVSFIKPIGEENEHPGYASEHSGSNHLVDLLKSVEGSACAKNTMVIVTYDEFGGQWDHVSPPAMGTRGPHDDMGPGTRIPALTIAPGLRHRFSVDSASHDTTSIMATIEHRYGLRPVSSRDATVKDMSTVFKHRHCNRRGHHHGGHH